MVQFGKLHSLFLTSVNDCLPMECNYQCGQSVVSLKRKLPEDGDHVLFNTFSLDDLNEDLFERILSWLPTSTFFRLNSVCKRWKSVADSASFKLACSRISSREPWFLMVAPNLNQSVIFDSSESSWKRLNHPPLLQEESNQNCMPVAASGGLICHRKSSGNFIVSNPVTGSCTELPPLHAPQHQPLNAIVMSTACKDQLSFKIVLVFGELPNLLFKVYDSRSGCWDDEIALRRKTEDNSMEHDSTDDNVVYFLSKAGIVVASNMQRSPSKQYSSVITNKDGQDIVYFLSSSGNVVACNLTCKCFFEYPRLLPVFSEYSIDVVECSGEMLVVLLSEFLETATLRVWRYDEANKGWHQIAAMPAANSHEWYGKKADINCVGAGNQILICLSSPDLCTYVMCDLETNKWVELPKCCINGEVIDFMSAFSFEPRIEASV
ncbi:hypothetical protein PHAVU_009G084700 [Phaseolus vulgaris]|uniref:F-box domain-containing protein n=2 Tax=Phaseolus vulgaris TaxID=3885 RepID=V7AUA4_PHAVU|nr:hypothetical protein PHAVU_009G084700g [Phaseolus vulgaris]ESW08910.1 hypothetical protein PHAVU_009G084700g [Phaseolus vulgaris]